MPEKTATERYGRVAIGFHWAIALLILMNWPLGYFGEAIEEMVGSSLVGVHKSIGLTILALSVLRLAWRVWNPPPPLPASLTRSRMVAARLNHALFYLLIILVPLTGWLRTSASHYPLTWFGLIDVPKFPISPQSAEAAVAAQSHELLAWAMLLLLLVHVGAAMHHHFRLRDAVLLRMMPLRRA